MNEAIPPLNPELIISTKAFIRLIMERIDARLRPETAIALRELATEIEAECETTPHD